MDTLGLFPRMKDQQLEQDDGEQRGGDPGSADACPPDRVVDGAECARAWFSDAAVPGRPAGPACWLRCHGPHLPSS